MCDAMTVLARRCRWWGGGRSRWRRWWRCWTRRGNFHCPFLLLSWKRSPVWARGNPHFPLAFHFQSIF